MLSVKIEIHKLGERRFALRCKVLEQTYICDKFYDGSIEFIASNGFILASVTCPALSERGLFVRGDDSGYNNFIVENTCPTLADALHLKQNILEAISEYNTKRQEKNEKVSRTKDSL